MVPRASPKQDLGRGREERKPWAEEGRDRGSMGVCKEGG